MRILRSYLLALFAVLAVTLAVQHGGTAASAHATVHIDAGIARAIRHYRVTTLRLQSVMGRRVVELRPIKHASLRRARTIWWRRAVAVRRLFTAGPAHRNAW